MNERPNLRLFAALLFFAGAIASVWLGLTSSPQVVRISAGYIAAAVLAILGVVILKLPESGKSHPG